MKAERGDADRLADIIKAAYDAIAFLEGRDEASLGADALRQAVLVRKIAVIGEAASRISAETKARLADIPWRDVIGMRNRVVHQYWEIATPALWETVHAELPALIGLLEASRDHWPIEEQGG